MKGVLSLTELPLIIQKHIKTKFLDFADKIHGFTRIEGDSINIRLHYEKNKKNINNFI